MSRPYLSYLSPRGDRADDPVDDAVDDELDYDYGYDYEVRGLRRLPARPPVALGGRGGRGGSARRGGRHRGHPRRRRQRYGVGHRRADYAPNGDRHTDGQRSPRRPRARRRHRRPRRCHPRRSPPSPRSPSATAAPTPAPAEAPAVNPRTVVYQVTGNRQLIDLVTVIYTDARGALQTDVNVALPWAKTIVLNPGVELSSITATSVGRSAQLQHHRRCRRHHRRAEQQHDDHDLHQVTDWFRPGRVRASVRCGCAAAGRRTRSSG